MRRKQAPPRDAGFSLVAIPGPPKDHLDYIGAVPFGEIALPREGECFVYGLDNAAGECFYVGLSESLFDRLGKWQRTYGNYLAGIRVLRCQDKDDMNRTENWLIKRMQPEMNTSGTETGERRRQAVATRAPVPYRRGAYNAVLADRERVS